MKFKKKILNNPNLHYKMEKAKANLLKKTMKPIIKIIKIFR